MMRRVTYSLNELAIAIGATVQGDGSCRIHNVSAVFHAKPGEISFISDPRYRKYLTQTKASAILLDKTLAAQCSINALVMPNPKLGFIKLLTLLRPQFIPVVGIHPTAIVSKNCQIDPSVHIGAYVVIKENVVVESRTLIDSGTIIGQGSHIGADCCLHSRVTLYHQTIIGDRTIIHSGAVIGADGFGLTVGEKGEWIKIPQIGRVVIGNDVEIGANATIDRGMLDDTVIGNGVKLDNLVMIAHNVRIGDHTAIAGCASIAGSTIVGQHCIIGGSAGLNGHIEVCDNVIITGMGMIQKSINKPGVYSSGTGMQTNRKWRKSVIRFWQLDELVKRLKRLEKIIR